MKITLSSVQVGRVAPLGPQSVRSGFVKQAVAGRVRVAKNGLAGDEQADLRVHGGPEKAVYGYALSHYSDWQAEFPEHNTRFVAGGLGENLTIAGLDESRIFVGDVHGVGDALLQVCQPRRPCYKLALYFSDSRLAKAMVRSGRTGWYYRVLREGHFEAGDEVALVERPHPDFSFARLVSIVNFGNATQEEISALGRMSDVATWIRDLARDTEQLREKLA